MESEFIAPSGMSRRNLFKSGALIATAAGATFVLSACGQGNDNGTGGSGKTSGKYMTAFGFSLSFVEVLVAKEQGFFDDVGLNLEVKGGNGTAPAIQATLGGSVDLSRTASINAIVARVQQDAPIISIANIFQQSQFNVVSLASKPIKNPSELEGKTCGVVSSGGSTENLLDMMLVNAGVDPKSVKRPITGVGTAAYEQAKKGAVDAWISVDSDRKVINDELGEVYYFNTDDFAKVPADTYNITSKTAKSSPEIPQKFLAGVLKGMEFASKPENAEQVVKDLQVYTPDASKELSLKSLPIVVDDWTAGGKSKLLELNDDAWKSGQESMKKAGLISKTVALDKLIDHSFLDAARKML